MLHQVIINVACVTSAYVSNVLMSWLCLPFVCYMYKWYSNQINYKFFSCIVSTRMATKLLRLVHDKKKEAAEGGTVMMSAASTLILILTILL